MTTQLWGIPRHLMRTGLCRPLTQGSGSKWPLPAHCSALPRLFVKSVQAVRTFAGQHIAHPVLRPFAGGLIVILLTLLVGSRTYNGLGTETVDLALLGADIPFFAPFLKIVFTAVTIGFGFIGGEVTPLLFVGATAGNVLAGLLGLPAGMMAKLGFTALLAGGTHTPVTGIMIGMELLGGRTPVYPATACILAYAFSGARGHLLILDRPT